MPACRGPARAMLLCACSSAQFLEGWWTVFSSRHPFVHAGVTVAVGMRDSDKRKALLSSFRGREMLDIWDVFKVGQDQR